MNVVFKHVKKNYGVINAIRDVDFEISSGEFVFLVGSSGAGKSTIIKLILNQTKPSSGEVLVDNQLMNRNDKKTIDKIRRQIGVIYQDYQLISDKTVEENIALALDIIGLSPDKIPEKVETVINQVSLGSRRHLFPSQLSGGELQRASLARALSVEPKIILADEPTGNLDAENAWNLIKLIKDINEQSGTTIIMTTHNLDIIQSMDKRIISLKNGEIVGDTKKNIIKKKKVKNNNSDKK